MKGSNLEIGRGSPCPLPVVISSRIDYDSANKLVNYLSLPIEKIPNIHDQSTNTKKEEKIQVFEKEIKNYQVLEKRNKKVRFDETNPKNVQGTGKQST